jgi:signal transduction histidine kinase
MIRRSPKKKSRAGNALPPAGAREAPRRRALDALAQADRRLRQLYEISKLFASFENVQQTFDPALVMVVKTLPLRSAMLIEAEDGRSRMVVWAAKDRDEEHLRAVKKHAQSAYTYLTGASSRRAVEFEEQAGKTAFARQPPVAGDLAKSLIVIPLVVARRPIFGALQLEVAVPLDRAALMFLNAIGNQLSIALDRDRARRRDIALRQRAEEETGNAQEKGAAAEKDRAIAENLREKYEALAAENARLYEEAQQAVRVREQILEIVSHDLKTPLHTILMTTALLEKGVPDEQLGGLPRTMGRIQRAAHRMVRLIGDLLDFASIQAGNLAIRRELQEVGPIIEETLASFDTLAQEKHLELTSDVEPQLPKIYCDRDRLLQVFSNLVANAAKVTAQGGHVMLRAEDRQHEILFTVADDGPGISKEDAKHVFERYWRSGEAQYKGTGLGLSIAQGIVAAHGGRIWAESEIGRGAKFFFTVPASADRRQSIRPSGGPLPPPAAKA